MSAPTQTLNITIPDLAAQQFSSAALAAVYNKIDTRMTAEELVRLNGDNALNQALNLLTDRVVVLEQKPDLVTDDEKKAIEKAISDFIANNNWSWFTADLSILVSGVNVSLRSAVAAILAARQHDRTEWTWGTHYCPVAAVVHFIDGESKVFAVEHTAIAAADMQAATGSATAVANDGERNIYTCADFTPGVSASLFNVFEFASEEVVPGVTVTKHIRRVDSYLTIALPGMTPAANPAPVVGVDVDGNTTTDGTNPLPPAPAPAPAPGPDLLSLAAAVTAAQNTYNDAEANRVTKQGELNTAQADLSAAQGSGDQAQIDTAQAAYDAAAMAVQGAEADVAAKAQLLTNAQAAYTTAS